LTQADQTNQTVAANRMSSRELTTKYQFGVITITLQGLGIYCGKARLEAICAGMSADKLREANKEAWKQRRHAERLMSRYCNATLHGCGPHDRASQLFDVADHVCKATWKFMRQPATA
jgi:hypothetical protein